MLYYKHMYSKFITRGLGTALVLCLWPSMGFAYHDRGGVNISGLDDDAVEEFFIPVLFGVTKDRVVPDFGAPRGGGTRQHEGQDFMAPKGTPVVSPTEAVVTSVGDGDSSGLYVSTANPGGESFRYMHLDTIADIKQGDRLKVGDLIGTVGDTGNAPDGVYHLHFEVWNKDREAVDPYPRFGGDLTLKEKAGYLTQVVSGIDGSTSKYLKTLVNTFASEFARMQAAGYKLPAGITTALKANGQSTGGDPIALHTLATKIPALLPTLKSGDTGPAVQLLQLYLIIVGDGAAIDKLAASGATGYYGPVTEAAVKAHQEATDVKTTGEFDTATKKAWTN